jgi:hypothetical protein
VTPSFAALARSWVRREDDAFSEFLARCSRVIRARRHSAESMFTPVGGDDERSSRFERRRGSTSDDAIASGVGEISKSGLRFYDRWREPSQKVFPRDSAVGHVMCWCDRRSFG